MKKNIQGFTLLELLIVLFMVGILMTVAIISLDTALRKHGKNENLAFLQRLHQMIDLTAESAVILQKEYGLKVEHDKVRLFSFNADTWQIAEIQNMPGTLAIPQQGYNELYLSGYKLDILMKKEEPEIQILSSGEMTPFEWSFIKGETRHTLMASPLGKVRLLSNSND